MSVHDWRTEAEAQDAVDRMVRELGEGWRGHAPGMHKAALASGPACLSMRAFADGRFVMTLDAVRKSRKGRGPASCRAGMRDALRKALAALDGDPRAGVVASGSAPLCKCGRRMVITNPLRAECSCGVVMVGRKA